MVTEADIQEVQLFGFEHTTYGDERTNPLREPGIHKGFNAYVQPGRVQGWFAQNYVGLFTDMEVHGAQDWIDNGSPPLPIILLPLSSLFRSGVMIINSSGSGSMEEVSTSRLIDGKFGKLASALHTNGSTVPYYFVAYGNGTGDPVRFRTLAGVWADCTGTPDEADGVFAENGNLWFIVNEYQVRKFPAGTDPTSGTAGAAIDVGSAVYPITGAGLLGRSSVVYVKPDGVYVYDMDTNRYENVFEGLRYFAHPDTGKGTITWGSSILIPLGWGGLVELTRDLQLIPRSPIPPEARPAPDTPGVNRIVSLSADIGSIWATTKPYQFPNKRGLRTPNHVKLYDGSSYTVVTNFKDKNRDTTFNLNTLGAGGATRFVYVGSTNGVAPGVTLRDSLTYPEADQFCGVGFSIESVGGAAAILKAEYYADDDTWKDLPSAVDETGDFELGESWYIFSAPSDWKEVAIDGLTDWWVRFSFIAALPSTTISEVRILYRARPYPQSPDTHMEEEDTGIHTHLLKGELLSNGKLLWRDVATLKGNFSHAIINSTALRHFAQAKRSLILAGPRRIVQYNLGARGDPSVDLTGDSTTFGIWTTGSDKINQASRAPSLWKSVVYIRGQLTNFKLQYSSSDSGFNFDDELYAWIRYDDGHWIFYGMTRVGGPTGKYFKFNVPTHRAGIAAAGINYQVALYFVSGVSNIPAPGIVEVIAGVQPYDESSLTRRQ